MTTDFGNPINQQWLDITTTYDSDTKILASKSDYMDKLIMSVIKMKLDLDNTKD